MQKFLLPRLAVVMLIMIAAFIPHSGNSGEVVGIQGAPIEQMAISQTINRLLTLAAQPQLAENSNYDPLPNYGYLYVLHGSNINLRPIVPAAAKAYFSISNWRVKTELIDYMNTFMRQRHPVDPNGEPHSGSVPFYEPGENLKSPDLIRMNIDFLANAPSAHLRHSGQRPLASLTYVAQTNPELMKSYPNLLPALRRVRELNKDAHDIHSIQTLFIQYEQNFVSEADLAWLVSALIKMDEQQHRDPYWVDEIGTLRYSPRAIDAVYGGYIVFAAWMASKLERSGWTNELRHFLREGDHLESYQRSIALLLLEEYSTEALVDFFDFRFKTVEEKGPFTEPRIYNFPMRSDQIPQHVLNTLEEKLLNSPTLQNVVRETKARFSKLLAESAASNVMPFFEKNENIRKAQAALVALNKLTERLPQEPEPPPTNVIDFNKYALEKLKCERLLKR